MHHIHHQVPPKYKIYLVGLPSVLYKTPGHNKRCVLNQLFLLLSGAFQWFSCTFHEKCHFSWKKTRSICVYTCTIYTYKLHQIPIKYNIYIVGIPSVLMKHQVIMRDLCWIRCFCCFSVLFTKSASFHKKKHDFPWKPTKPDQYVCIHVPFTHTCTIYTTKYHKNVRYT